MESASHYCKHDMTHCVERSITSGKTTLPQALLLVRFSMGKVKTAKLVFYRCNFLFGIKKPPLGGPGSHKSVAYEKQFLGMKS